MDGWMCVRKLLADSPDGLAVLLGMVNVVASEHGLCIYAAMIEILQRDSATHADI